LFCRFCFPAPRDGVHVVVVRTVHSSLLMDPWRKRHHHSTAHRNCGWLGPKIRPSVRYSARPPPSEDEKDPAIIGRRLFHTSLVVSLFANSSFSSSPFTRWSRVKNVRFVITNQSFCHPLAAGRRPTESCVPEWPRDLVRSKPDRSIDRSSTDRRSVSQRLYSTTRTDRFKESSSRWRLAKA
jgi:hypothetical protein